MTPLVALQNAALAPTSIAERAFEPGRVGWQFTNCEQAMNEKRGVGHQIHCFDRRGNASADSSWVAG